MTGFTFGPEWAAGTRCCGKPVGCTNMTDDCVMRNHPWKQRYATAEAEAAEAPAVTTDLSIPGGLLLAAVAVGVAVWCWLLLAGLA